MGLTAGRFFFQLKQPLQHRSKHPALKWAGWLNASAAMALVAYLVIFCHYQPLYFATIAAATELRPMSASELDDFYRFYLPLTGIFWIIMVLVRSSLLCLYRGLFDVSRRFRVAWWGVAIFTAITSLAGVVPLAMFCSGPDGLLSSHGSHSPIRRAQGKER